MGKHALWLEFVYLVFNKRVLLFENAGGSRFRVPSLHFLLPRYKGTLFFLLPPPQ